MKGDLRAECKELQIEVEEKYASDEQEALRLSHALRTKTNKAFAKFEATDREAVQGTKKNIEKIASLIGCISTSVLSSREYMSAHQNDEATQALRNVLEDLNRLQKEHCKISSDL